MEPIELAAAFAIALGGVEVAKVAISALREAIAKRNGNGKTSYNGSGQEVVDWLKEINLSISKLEKPLDTLQVEVGHLSSKGADEIRKLDQLLRDTSVIKDRRMFSCPLTKEK